jgi:hypothetical protein
VGEIDSSVFEEGGDFGVGRVPLVDGVLGFVILVGGSSNGETRARNRSEGVRSGLSHIVAHVAHISIPTLCRSGFATTRHEERKERDENSPDR